MAKQVQIIKKKELENYPKGYFYADWQLKELCIDQKFKINIPENAVIGASLAVITKKDIVKASFLYCFSPTGLEYWLRVF